MSIAWINYFGLKNKVLKQDPNIKFMGSETRFTDEGYDRPSFAISRKIMMATIIILCLHIYAHWFWGRSLGSSGWRSASSRRRRLAFAGNQDPVRLQRVGLEKSVIEALPVFVYKSESHTDGLECAVCLCEFEENEKARLLPKCNHSFHIECIDMWFDSHSTCPLCRTSAQPDLPSTDPVVVVVVGEASGSGSGENEEVRVSVRVDGNPSETEPTSEPDLCVSCRHEDSLPSPTYPTNVLFWGTQNQINARSSSVKLDQGTSSRKSLEKIVIDIPRRTDSFSSPRFFSGDDQQIYSPSGQSMKSPSTRLRSLKRILSREKRVIPQSPDAGCDNAEQSGQVQS